MSITESSTKITEIFKDIPNYEQIYQVSNLGNVKSLERWSTAGRKGYLKKERVLKSGVNNRGYLIVGLCKNSKLKSYSVHKLVAMAFLNHKPCGYKLVVNHINFDKTDNRIDNIEIVTQRENSNLKHIKSSSKYTGVSWHKPSEKWRSQIVINGGIKHLGTFHNEYDAHLAYQKELKKVRPM